MRAAEAEWLAFGQWQQVGGVWGVVVIATGPEATINENGVRFVLPALSFEAARWKG